MARLAPYKISNPPSVAFTERELGWEFERWGVRAGEYFIDYNVQRARMNNRTLSREERAVTVRWIPHGETREIVIASDDQPSIAANLRKLFLGVQAMRLNERRGLGEVMRNAYLQLPGPSGETLTAYGILDVPAGASADAVREAYRVAARKAHPDHGGSDEAMSAVNQAYEQIKRERGWS